MLLRSLRSLYPGFARSDTYAVAPLRARLDDCLTIYNHTHNTLQAYISTNFPNFVLYLFKHTFSTMNTNTNHIEPRAYGFKELAVLFFPYIAPASASIRLKQWIKDSPTLLDSLRHANYKPTARILTPRQTELIIQEFGSPF